MRLVVACPRPTHEACATAGLPPQKPGAQVRASRGTCKLFSESALGGSLEMGNWKIRGLFGRRVDEEMSKRVSIVRFVVVVVVGSAEGFDAEPR